MIRRRIPSLLLVPAFFLSAGCDRETAPLPPAAASRPVAQAALASSTDQTFDVTISSTREGETPKIRVLHIARHRTGRGWRTSIRIDPTEVPMGQPPLRNEITGVEIDEDGKQMISIEGRPAISVSGSVKVGKGPKGIAVEELATPSMAGFDPFDMLDKAVFAKSESSSRMARVAEKLGSRPIERDGRLVYQQKTAHGPAEFEYDPSSGLSLRAKGPGPKNSTLAVEHIYTEAGGLLVRTSTRNTLAGSGNPRVITVSLSHITVNGKEIVQ